MIAANSIAKVEVPSFLAVNHKRSLTINPSQADVCALAATVADLQHEVKSLEKLTLFIGHMNNKADKLSEQCIYASRSNMMPPLIVASNDIGLASVQSSELNVHPCMPTGNQDNGYRVVKRRKSVVVQSES